MRKWTSRICAMLLATVLLTGCGASVSEEVQDIFIDAVPLGAMLSEAEVQVLTESAAALPESMKTVASGTKEKKSGKAVIDYSNVEEGYVMVKYTASTQKRLKAQVKGPTTTYTYNLTAGQWEVFPLSDGNGDYKVAVYENVSGTKYSAVVRPRGWLPPLP